MSCRTPAAHAPFSEMMDFRFLIETVEYSGGILQIQNLCMNIVFVIHFSQPRICLQKRILSFRAWVINKLCCDSPPCSLTESTDLTFRICCYLSGNLFVSSCLNVQPVFKNVCCTKWSYPWLITIDCRQIIHTGPFQKFTCFFRSVISLYT